MEFVLHFHTFLLDLKVLFFLVDQNRKSRAPKMGNTALSN
jgi:hypothetical protein